LNCCTTTAAVDDDMKQFYLFIVGLIFCAAAQAQVRIGTTNYASFQAAFDVINNTTTYSGQNIVMEITANFTETSFSTLGKYNYASILIKPSGGARTVVFASFGLSFFGSNVTIDGENQLTLACTHATSATVAFTGSANVIVKRTKIFGGGNSGVLTFRSHTDLGQAKNILVQHCEIGAYTGNWPTSGIYVLGTPDNGWLADGIVIDGNNIHDFAAGTQTVPASGVDVGEARNVNIKNNRIYQTELHSSNLTRAISVHELSLYTNNYITANEIGSANAQGAGMYRHTGGSFVGIFYYNDGAASTAYGTLHVEGNSIRNIALTGSYNYGASTFCGIQSYLGSVRIINNTIGSQTETNSITINNSSSGECNFEGITTDYNGVAVITNNTVGGMTGTGNGTMQFKGIYTSATSTDGNQGLNLSGNTIGGTVANSIQNNATTSNSRTVGIYARDRNGGPSGNTIRNITGFSSGTGDYGVVGITQYSSYVVNPVTNNTIFNLTNANASAGGSVVGIQLYSAGSGGSVRQNFIHGLQSFSTNNAATVYGILTTNAPVNMYNNMIALGNGTINNAQVTGIKYQVLATASGQGEECKNNSVYIGGYNTNGSSLSRAFWITGLNSGYSVYNNIFVNNRSNYAAGAGTHYSVQAETSYAAFVANVYFGNGNGYVLASTPAGNKTTIAQFHSYLYFPGNSGFLGDPHFLSPTAITPNLHINPAVQTIVEGRGYDNIGIDIDNETRSGLTPNDIGADAGNFVPMNNAPTINSFSNITTCTIGNFTLSGTNLSGVHEARIGTLVFQIIVATDTSITISCGTEPVSGTIKLTNAIGSAVSTGTITLNARPAIIAQPQSLTTCPGLATLTVTATYATAYQWRRNGIPLTNNANYSGVTTATLTVNNAAPNSAEQYDVVLTGSAGCTATSFPATLTVNGYNIELVASGPTTFCAGEFIQLTPKVHVPALQFDGVNDYIDFYGANYQDFTMSFWVKTTQTGSTGPQWYDGNGIVDGLGGFNRNFGTSLVGDKLAFGVKVGEWSDTVLSSTSINTGEWVNVTVTRSQMTSQIRIYINAVLDATASTGLTTGFELANQSMRAGALMQGSSYFNGAIDDIKIWSRILGDGEIQYVNNGGNVTNMLSVQLAMDENLGNQTTSTQNGQNVPLMNGVQWTDRLAPAMFTNPVWSNGQNANVLGVSTSGSYSLTANFGNCQLPLTSNTVTVNVISPTVHLNTPSNNLFYCGGPALQIQAEGAVNYTWSPAQGLSATTGNMVYANPTTTTNYLLQGTDANGCVGYYNFTVFVGQTSQITLNTGNSYIVSGQAIPLTASGGSGNYTWSPAEGLSQTSGNNVVASPTQTTVYTVRGTGCDIEQTVTIYVLPETSATDNALDFDGFDDYVEMPVQSQGISGTFTVAVWVKPTHPTKTMHILSTRNGANANTFDIQIKDGNLIHGDIGNGTDWLTTSADAPFAYQANQWMHIAYKITPGQYKIFVNGNLIQTGVYPGEAVLYNNSSNFITLGKNNGENTLLQGSIDDLIISTFNFPDEVMANVPRHGIPAQIRYTFDEGIAGGYNPTVTLLSNQDVQGGMHGVLHNFTLNGNASNWVAGQGVQPQTIAMAEQNSIVYGTIYNPGATTSSGLPVTYDSSDPSIASVSGNTLVIHNVGTVTVFAHQDGNAFYDHAEPKFQQLTITPKALTIANATAQNKIYDRTASATISGTLSGMVGTDAVSFTGTGTFASFNVGNQIAVTPNSVLTGNDAPKYTLVQPNGLSANITPKSLTVSGAVAANKVYDGSTVAVINGAALNGIISPDVVTIASNAGTFASPNVGNNISVSSQLTLGGTSAPNYSIIQPTGLLANITPTLLTATISGTSAICQGQNTVLQVAISGAGLFTVVYSDGTLSYTINNYSSGDNIAVAPVSTSMYALVSVTGNNAQVAVSGSATVTVVPQNLYYADADGDGYGNAAVSQYRCVQPVGFVPNNTDCDDSNAGIHQMFSFYTDNDHDGFGTGSSVNVCAASAAIAPVGYSINNTDCDDSNAAIHQMFSFYTDNDHDGFGTGSSVNVCAASAAIAPVGYSINSTDCDDTNAAIHQTFQFYTDADRDGYGAGSLVPVCAADALVAPIGYALNNTDCNDNNSAIYQSAICYVDADFDGYSSGMTASVCYGATIPAGFLTASTALDCNDAVAAIHPNSGEVPFNGVDDNCNGLVDETGTITTTLLASSCGTTLTAIGSLVGIQTLAGHPITGYRIRVTNGAQVQTIETNVPHFSMTQFSSYDYAKTYTVAIQLQRAGIWQSNWGTPCFVSTPAILAGGAAGSVNPSQCGVTLAKINTLIATTSLAGVTGYRFQVTNLSDPLGPNALQTIDRVQNWFSLQMLTRYNYGTNYRIEVAVKTTGTFGGYGAPCEVASPDAPALVNCGGSVALPTTPVATVSLPSVTQYRFQVTRLSDNAASTIDRNSNFFTFNMVPAAIFTAGSLYSVRVAVMTAGTWSPYGDACEIMSPGGTAKFAPTTSVDGNVAFKATAAPSPFTASFGIEVQTAIDQKVQLKMYDMLGRLVESKTTSVSEVNQSRFGQDYPSGVYQIIVSQGDEVQTLRVVKR